jgi:nickel transport protein
MTHRVLGVCAACLVLAALPARAHKAKCFAAADGETVAGYAWLSGGGRPRNVPYRVLAPDGTELHTGVTDANGAFAFVPREACDHTIVVDAGAGHTARFTVRAADLPARAAASDGAEPMPGATPAAIEAAVARAVSQAVAPLRRELAAERERLRLQDIVAGLGFIAGLTGAAFFVLGARERRRRP